MVIVAARQIMRVHQLHLPCSVRRNAVNVSATVIDQPLAILAPVRSLYGTVEFTYYASCTRLSVQHLQDARHARLLLLLLCLQSQRHSGQGHH